MRPDIPANLTAALAAQGCAPVQYLIVKFPPEKGGWQYISDRPFEWSTGNFCTPLVVSWGVQKENIGSAVVVYNSLVVKRDQQVSLLNTEDTGWWAKYMHDSGQNTVVEVWQAEAGVTDKVLLGTYVIKTPLHCSSASPTITITLASRLTASNPLLGVEDGRGGRYPLAVGGVTVKVRMDGIRPFAKLAVSAEKGSTGLQADRDLKSAGWPMEGRLEINGVVYEYSGLYGAWFDWVRIAGYGPATIKDHKQGEVITSPDADYIFGVAEVVYNYTDVDTDFYGSYTSWIDANGIIKLRNTGGTIAKKNFDSYSEVEGHIDFNSFGGLSLIAYGDGRKAIIRDFEETVGQGIVLKWKGVFCQEGTWYFDNVVTTSKDFGVVIPSTAFDFEAEINLQCVFYSNLPVGDPLNWQQAELHGKLANSIITTPTTFDRKSVVETIITNDKRDVAPGANYLEVQLLMSRPVEDVGEFRCFGMGNWTIDYSYKLNDPGYPYVEYYVPSEGECYATINAGEQGKVPPVIVINYLLAKVGLSLDTSSKNAVAALHRQQGYWFRGIIDGNKKLLEVLQDCLLQCRCRLIERGDKLLIAQQEIQSISPSLFTFTESNCFYDSFDLAQPDISSVINYVAIKYNCIFEGKYSSQLVFSSTEHVNKYGRQQVDLDGYLIESNSHANSIAEWIVEDNKNPPVLLSIGTSIDRCNIELGDKVEVNTGYSDIISYKGIVSGMERLFSSLSSVNKLIMTIRARSWKSAILRYFSASTAIAETVNMVASLRLEKDASTNILETAYFVLTEVVYVNTTTLLVDDSIIHVPVKTSVASNTVIVETASFDIAPDLPVGLAFPDTGQTIVSATGDDAEYGWDVTDNDPSDGLAGFSYTKLDAAGGELPASASSWEYTRDNRSGLIYRFNGSVTATWDEAMAAAAAYTGLGKSWRLPTIKELVFLANYWKTGGVLDPMVATASSGFPFSGTEYTGTSNVWALALSDGHTDKAISKSSSSRPQFFVTGTQLVPSFTDNGDGTVTDSATGLMWSKTTIGTVASWNIAISTANDSTLAGYDDWRVANIKEIHTIIDFAGAISTPAIPAPFVIPSSTYLWTSTTSFTSSSYAWFILMQDSIGGRGWMSSPMFPKGTSGLTALLVRNQ